MRRVLAVLALLLTEALVPVSLPLAGAQPPNAGQASPQWRPLDVSSDGRPMCWQLTEDPYETFASVTKRGADPGDHLLTVSVFLNGVPRNIVRVSYLGLDNAGISLDRQSAFLLGDEGKKTALARGVVNPCVEVAVIETLIFSIASTRGGVQKQQLRLPNPPTTLAIPAAAGERARFTLTLNGTTLSAVLDATGARTVGRPQLER